jgi:hypothetical protein
MGGYRIPLPLEEQYRKQHQYRFANRFSGFFSRYLLKVFSANSPMNMVIKMQIQPNERSHATGISRASPKAHFVVHLKVTWYAYTYPDGAKPINNALARSCGQRLYGTTPRHYVH